VYTTPAWTDLLAAKAVAEAVLGDPYAIQQEIDDATDALAAALVALKADDDGHWFYNNVDSHEIGSTQSLIHIAVRDLSLHTGKVSVDGVVLVAGVHYTSASGSTQTTLLASYLDTLAVGTHTLRVEFSSGLAPAADTFSIKAAGTSGTNPPPDTGDTNDTDGSRTPATGDGTSVMLLALACGLVALATTAVWRARRRRS
jgi:hypothetical protein